MDLKEHSIRQYISNIDFKNDDWKVSKIQEDMRRLLGEEPGIDIVYKKDVMINEVTGDAKEFVDVDKIQIIFTGTDDKFKKIEFIVGEKI
jgi:threonine aldolase